MRTLPCIQYDWCIWYIFIYIYTGAAIRICTILINLTIRHLNTLNILIRSSKSAGRTVTFRSSNFCHWPPAVSSLHRITASFLDAFWSRLHDKAHTSRRSSCFGGAVAWSTVLLNERYLLLLDAAWCYLYGTVSHAQVSWLWNCT